MELVIRVRLTLPIRNSRFMTLCRSLRHVNTANLRHTLDRKHLYTTLPLKPPFQPRKLDFFEALRFCFPTALSGASSAFPIDQEAYCRCKCNLNTPNTTLSRKFTFFKESFRSSFSHFPPHYAGVHNDDCSKPCGTYLLLCETVPWSPVCALSCSGGRLF